MVSGFNQNILYALIKFSNNKKLEKKNISPGEHKIGFNLSEENFI